ncbi:MAG: outer membrane protein assembly factor BamB, partial [Verrucomicrobiota bacterium]
YPLTTVLWRKWWGTLDDRHASSDEVLQGRKTALLDWEPLQSGKIAWGSKWYKLKPQGAGAWSHAYGDASNTANSGDSVVADGEVGLRWFGEPGARGMMDRQPRNAPPLCINGTFYIQGNNRLFALDAYNGAVRWSVEVPNLRRVNVPRDSSNMCASTYALFVAVKDRVWKFSANDGSVDQELKVPAEDRDWGWLACHQDTPDTGATVFGSTIKPGSTYTEFEGGEAFWYETHTAASTAKVLSDSVFAHDLWTDKSAGVIINSTLCLGGGRIYFVENPTFPFSTGRAETLDLYKGAQLVALDAKTGKRLWSKPIDIGKLGIAEALYLSYSDEKLVLLDSANKAYHTFAFSAKDGKDLWNRTHPWKRDHHGGHLYHPVIVRGMVIVEPFGYDLASGEIRLSEMPERGGCSTLSAAKDALHFINWDYDKGSLYTWDLAAGTQRKFSGSRGNCFLSFISGSGMMLLPTASGGCSCRYPNQVSLGFGSK